MQMVLLVITGVVLTLSGVLLLQQSWRERRAGQHARRRVLVVLAWSVLGIALLPWAVAIGTDKGIAYALLALMLAGATLVLRAGFAHAPRQRKGEREPRNNGGAVEVQDWRLLLRRSWVFLLAGPICGIAAVFMTAVMFATWNVETGSAANRLAATILLVPIAWALLATWSTYDVSLKLRSFSVLGLLAASVALTLAMTPEVM